MCKTQIIKRMSPEKKSVIKKSTPICGFYRALLLTLTSSLCSVPVLAQNIESQTKMIGYEDQVLDAADVDANEVVFRYRQDAHLDDEGKVLKRVLTVSASTVECALGRVRRLLISTGNGHGRARRG